MASQVQGTDPRQLNYSTQLATKYEGLKTRIKDAICKCQDMADEHQGYQTNYSQAMDWVSTLRKRLQVCADLVGDRQDVEDRLAKLQELAAEKDDGRHSIMQTIDMGEKLYPSTASEGRDAIRQDLRNLREQWESLCDEVALTQRKLESTMMEWAAYDENFEQFQKWLLDVEVKLKEDAELKTTLPDKKAQLQNHKVLHQDILSRQHIIQSLSEKAQNLTQSSPAAKVQKFVNELNNKYEKLCKSSKKILGKFETAVKDHQQYQDACHDFQDWLNLSREKLESCTDRSGDKLSLQSKKERLKDFTNSISVGETKLSNTKELCNKTFKNTSPSGCDILRRELEHLQREWDDYRGLMSQAEMSLDQAMVQWAEFETKFDTCADWLKEMEQQVKSYELKSTLKEKETQVDKFKKQREEILSHQPEIDRFMDDAQNLMHTSSDVRLSTQVSQLTNRYQALLSLVKDLINKWEKYVHEHNTYDNRLSEFNQWLHLANQRLETCQQPVGDQESVEEKRALIQILFSEKEHGLQKLNLTIEAGEKLYPDTAALGREKVRQDIRSCKESWERLFTGLNDAQRKVDAFLLQWSSYADGQDQLMRWLGETEAALRSDVEVKNTLQEKRLQLQTHRSLLQDIHSHQRLIDSVVEKAQGVLQTTANADVASFITSVNSRYEKLTMDAKALISKSEQHVLFHQQYQDALHAAVDWMTQMKDKQTMCADTSGDRQTIQNKLDRLHELNTSLPDGMSKIKECEENAEATMNTTALKGRQSIQQEVDVLHLDWEDYTQKLNSLKDNLEQALHYWIIYEENYDKVAGWIKDMEKKVKEVPLKSTLEEKREQLTWYQALYEEIVHQDIMISEVDDFHQDLRNRQHDIDKFTDEAQTLQQLTGEARVGNFASQLAARYQTLLTAAKSNIKKCEQNVEDHKLFKEKFNNCSQWLAKAKAKFAECSDASGSRAELEERLEKAQDLLRDRDAGFAKLSQVVEAGEKLYPNSAPEGRESTRQDLRKLKLDWESLFDDLSAVQRRLEVSLVQWTSFDDSYSQVENWLREMETQLEGTTPLRSTLEEKKSQLHNYKALHQDVLSYQRVIDSISDKAQSLVQSSNNPELSRFISGTGTRYQKLCIAAKDRVQQYEVFVADHQQYNDAYNSCVDWLNSIREKLSVCSDVSGDRHAIQSRLDKIQRRCDILATRMEGEPKVKNVVVLAEKVLPHTAPQGKEIIVRETDALRADWEAFISALAKTKSDLESCMIQWKEFETWQEKCADWLKESENKIRSTDLKSTLQEKQSQLERLKALQTDVGNHQGDLDSLSDAAQDLVQLSTDTRVVSQVSQLSTKYQMINVNIKELCRRWEQYVLDHESYITSFDQCRTWLRDMKDKVSAVMDVSGDKGTIQDRLKRVQELMSEKEEGLHMLQIALDNLQVVLPNTSVGGRDSMRREMQAMQQDYDGLSGDLNEVKLKLDGCLAQWTVYDDSVQQLQRWLHDLETQVQTDSQLQNTLQEKKLQLDRVKVLQLNINSQQSTIDSMNDKAQSLKQTSKDTSLSNQITEIISRYEKLGAKTKELLQNCDTNLRNHQLYRDSYVDMTDWLAAAMDRLSMCSDIRGDRHAIEALQHKVQEIVNTVDTGKQKMETVRTKGESILPQTSSHGQELIKEELTMLANDFAGFESNLADLVSTLENLHDQWQRYEVYYEELSQWIKDMEASMKADSELKSTVEHKTIQLEKQKNVHEEIIEQQTAFDNLAEQAQILMQSSKDSRVSTQLTQMGSRYTTLMTLSKDLMKRYEQHCQDHQQYSEVYNEAISWLQATRDKLSVCADTSGDRYTIQTQLEKLQEFNVMKEEGQVLIHTANTWGEKTMMNSSVTGREMIREELQQLQTDWDELVSEVTDTKVLLESCLLQWTEFSDSHSNVQKWLKEMEKKLRETSPKADLSEKKGELQRIKVIYQDIVSYEQMVESMTVKAHHLAEKSPASHTTTDTSQIAGRYHTVKEQAKELLAKNEQYVANHQDFLDNCNQFIMWLRTAIEKLATCSDTYGEKSAIEGKIERVQALVQNLTEGTQRLSLATKSGEATLPSTSPKGQTKIRHELQTMHKDFDEFRGQLVKAQSDLEVCLSRWEEFEASFQEFNQWLKDTENMMRSEFDQKGTVDEKKHQWEQYQHRLDDILSHQSSLDCVSEKGQALLETNADARISHSITQITTRYQAVIAHSKDLVNSLEASYKNHASYRQNKSQFGDWLVEIKRKLQEVEDDRGTKDSIGEKLDHIDQMQDFMDYGHNLLRALLESSEKTQPSTNQKGCHIIRQETDTAKSEYEDILTKMSQARRNLENALTHWSEFDRLYSQLERWLTDLETKLRMDQDYKADLPEKRSNLEKFKAIESDIMGHQDILDKLREKADLVKDSAPGSNLAGLLSRFQNVAAISREAMGKAEEQVMSHEEYRKAYIGCLDWLANTKHRLQRLSDYSGDKRTLQDRLQQLRDFKSDLHTGQDMVNRVASLGDRLCQTTAPRGQDIIRREVQSLREDWGAFSTAVTDVENNLESCISNWLELDDDHTILLTWLTKMENDVKGLSEPRANQALKMRQYKEGEDLYDDIIAKKGALDKVREKGDSIAQRSSDPRLSNSMMQLSTKYQSLCSSAKSMLQRLRDNLHDQQLYDDSLNAAAKWLSQTQERVRVCSDTSGDWHSIQDRIEDIKDVTSSMDEGLQKVNFVCDMAEKILPNTSKEGKKLIEEQVTDLTNDWEKLNDLIHEGSNMLEGVQQRWHEYEEYYGSIVKWLADMENILRQEPEAKTTLAEKKTLQDKYKLILQDIDTHHRLVNELADRVANLEALCSNPEVSASLADIENRYEAVRTKARQMVDTTQNAYEDHLEFHEAQQEAEKWLLQMSYRLMSHNSLNVSSLEMTQRQIDKHRVLLREIEDYRHTLDQVNRKGQQLIASNRFVPQLAQQIQSQIQNLEESYSNLELTARQIRDRLNDVFQKWQQYKDLLDTAMNFLQDDLPSWLQDNEADVPDTLEEAQSQRESTQSMLDKLTQMKQELTNSSVRCENLGSMDSLDQTEAALTDSIAQLADKVNGMIHEAINQVEKRLDRLRDIIRQWDSVDRQRTDLRHWLHSKQEEVNDLEQRPSKLHAEAAELDIEKLKALRDEIQARGPAIKELLAQYHALTEHNPSLVDPVVRALQDDWEEVLGELDILIDRRRQEMVSACDLQLQQETMDEDLENYVRELERIDQSESSVQNKSMLMKKLSEDVAARHEEVDEIRTKVNEMASKISPQDAELVEDRIRTEERKYADLLASVERKQKLYNVMDGNLDEIREEAEKYLAWLTQQEEKVREKVDVGYQVKEAEAALEKAKDLYVELDHRQVTLDSVAKKAKILIEDLPVKERDDVEHLIATVQREHDKVYSLVQQKCDMCEQAVLERVEFQSSLEKENGWLQEKERLAEKNDSIRLLAVDVDKQTEKCKNLSKEVQSHMTHLEPIKDKADSLKTECSEETAAELDHKLDDISRRYENLLQRLKYQYDHLRDCSAARKQFETDSQKIDRWCMETDIKCSGELTLDCAIEILQEQVEQYKNLDNSSHMFDSLVSQTIQLGEGFKPELYDTDLPVLEQQLDALRDKHQRASSQVSDRLTVLETTLKIQSQTQSSIEETARWLTDTQDQLREASVSIGPSVSDAEHVVARYEAIEEKIAEYQSTVASLNQSVEPLRSAGHVSSADEILHLTSQYELLIDQVTQQLNRCRLAVVARQQFHTQLEEMENTVLDCENQIESVTDLGVSIPARIEKYTTVLGKLEDLEHGLFVTEDRAQQIGKEGTEHDAAAIADRLKKLRSKVDELTKTATEKSENCKKIQQEREDFDSSVEQTLSWLEQKENALASCETLDLDSTKVKPVLIRHQDMTQQALDSLNSVKTKAQFEVEHYQKLQEPIPPEVSAKLVQIETLEESIREATQKKEQYLVEAQADRELYENSIHQVTSWLKGAEELLDSGYDGLDYDTLDQTLSEYTDYFSEASLCQDEMDQVMELSERLLLTLDPNDKETLQQSLHKVSNKLAAVQTASQKKQEQLEEKTSEWREFLESHEELNGILQCLEEEWTELEKGPLTSPAEIQQAFQLTKEFCGKLEANRPSVDEQNERARSLDRVASSNSRSVIDKLMTSINNRWDSLTNECETRQTTLEDMGGQWQDFNSMLQSAGEVLRLSQDKLEVVNLQTVDSAQLVTQIHQIEEVLADLELVDSKLDIMKKSSFTLQRSLPTAEAKVQSQEQFMVLMEKFERFRDEVKEQEQVLQEEIDDRGSFLEEVTQSINWLTESRTELNNLKADNDQTDLKQIEKHKMLEQDISVRMEQMRRLVQTQEAKYSSQGRELPQELQIELERMKELQADVLMILRVKEEELTYINEDRRQYMATLQAVTTWLTQADAGLQEHIVSIPHSQEKQQALLSEFEDFKQQLDKLRTKGGEIIRHCHDSDEKQGIQKTLADVNRQWLSLQAATAERTRRLNEAVELSLSVKEATHNLDTWAEQTESLIQAELTGADFNSVKEELKTFKKVSREVEQTKDRLTNLNVTVKQLSQLCDASDATDRLDTMNRRLASIENQTENKMQMLEERSSRMEGYEKEISDLMRWLEQTRIHLSMRDTTRSLKEQLVTNEKLLQNVKDNKTRAQMVLQKHAELQNISGDTTTSQASRVMTEMLNLEQAASETCDTLRDAIEEQEKYEEEIQQLNATIADAQEKLLASPVMATSVEALKKQIAEHDNLASQIKNYQMRVNEINEKSRELSEKSLQRSPTLVRKRFMLSATYGTDFQGNYTGREPPIWAQHQNGYDSFTTDSGLHISSSMSSNTGAMRPGFSWSSFSEQSDSSTIRKTKSQSFRSSGNIDDFSGGEYSRSKESLLSNRSDNLEHTLPRTGRDVPGQMASSGYYGSDSKLSSKQRQERYGGDSPFRPIKSDVDGEKYSSRKQRHEPQSLSPDTSSHTTGRSHSPKFSVSQDSIRLASESPEDRRYYSPPHMRSLSPMSFRDKAAVRHGVGASHGQLDKHLGDAAEQRERSASFGTRVSTVGRPLGQTGQVVELNMSLSSLQQQAAVKEKELQTALQKQERYQHSVQDITAKMEQVHQRLTQQPLLGLADNFEQEMQDYKESLQELEGIKEDIAKVKERGRQLMEQSDPEGYQAMQATLTMMTDRLDNLQTIADDKGKQLQDAARQKEKHNIHLQAYKKRVSELESWMDEMKVRHATSGLTTEGPEALQQQLQDNRELQDEINKRQQLIHDLALQCDNVCESESPATAEKLRNQLASIQNQLGEFKLAAIDKQSQLRSTMKESEKRHREMEDYESNVAKLQQWITDTKQMTMSPLTTEVSVKLPEQQKLQQELASDLSEHQQLVRQISLSGQRYQEAGHGVDGDRLKTPPTLTEAQLQLQWENLQRDISNKKSNLEDIVRTRKPGEIATYGLHSFGSSADTIRNLNEVRQIIGDLGECWEQLQDQVEHRQLRLEDALSFQQQFLHALQSISSWLDFAEQRVLAPDSSQSTETQLRENEALQHEIKALQGEITKMSNQAQQLLASTNLQSRDLIQQTLASLNDRVIMLEGQAQSQGEELRKVNSLWKQYQDEVRSLHTGLQEAQKMISTQPQSSSLPQLTTEMKVLNPEVVRIEHHLHNCEGQLEHLKRRESELTAHYPQGTVPSELNTLQTNYMDLQRKVMDRKASLLQSTSQQEQYATLLNDYTEFILTAEGKLQTDSISSTDLAHLKQQLSSHKDFFSDLEVHKAMLDSMASQCDPTSQEDHQAQHSRLSNQTHVLVDQASLHGQRLERLVRQWSELDTMYTHLQQVLSSIEQQIPKPVASGDSLATIQEKLTTYQRLQKQLGEEKGAVFEVVDRGKQILHSVNCPTLEALVTDMADKWVDLNTRLTQELKKMETLGDQLQTFEAEATILNSWLATAKMKLASMKQLTEKDRQSMAAIRTKVEKLLEFQKEVENQLPLKNKVITVGRQLLQNKNYNTTGLDDRLAQFEDEWEHLQHDIRQTEEFLHQAQMDLMPSRQALHELESWLEEIKESLQVDREKPVKTLADIEVMLKKYKGYKIELSSKQMTMDFVNQSILQPMPQDPTEDFEKVDFGEKLAELNRQWKKAMTDVGDRLHSLEQLQARYDEYEQALLQLQSWFHEQEDKIKKYQLIGHGVAVKQTLKECKAMQEHIKNKESDLEGVKKLAGELIDLSADSPGCQRSVRESIEDLNRQWLYLEEQLLNVDHLLHDMLGQWERYSSELQDINQLLTQTEYCLNQYSLVGGDINTLRAQADKLKNLESELAHYEDQLESFVALANQLTQVCEDPVRTEIQKTVADIQTKRRQLARELAIKRKQFDDCLHHWQLYETQYNEIRGWLDGKERLCQDLAGLRDDPSKQGECFEQCKQLQMELDNVQTQVSDLYRLSDELAQHMDTSTIAILTSRQTLLEQRLMNLRQMLSTQSDTLKQDMSQLSHFSEVFDFINNFLTYAENILGAEDPNKSADESDLRSRMDQLKDLLSQFNTNSDRLDGLNGLGYRLALCDGDANRLSDLNHRWYNLYGECKERCRTLQGNMLVQQDFTEKCESWMTFLAQTEQDLALEIGDNLADLLDQQRKCEKFESDMYARQQVLHAIINDGQQMLKTGDVEDEEEFKQKLQLLAEQWQSVSRRANQRKAIIDNTIKQWKMFNSLSEQLRDWLNRQEKDLESYQFESASLQQIRNLLEKVRNTQGELRLQEDNLKKVRDLGNTLLQRADGDAAEELKVCLAQLQHSYLETFSQLEEHRAHLEEVLKEWKECEEDIEDILGWLKETRKSLSSELPSKYDDLQSDLSICKDISTAFANSEDRRQTLLAREKKLSRLIQSEDMNILHQRIRLLNKQWDELSSQSALRDQRIRDSVCRWSGFGDQLREITEWIDDMEVKVISTREMHVEDLLEKLETEYKHDLMMKERIKSDLVDQGHRLMKVSSEIRAADIEHRLQKLEDRWQHLKAVVNFRERKLRETVLAVKQLDISMRNLGRWLTDIEQELSGALVYRECDMQDIQAKLQHQQELQQDIEHHSAGVASVLNLCEVLLHDSDACPTAVEFNALQNTMKTLDRRWRNICELSPDRRSRIEETWVLWESFRENCKTFSDWLVDVETEIGDCDVTDVSVEMTKDEIRKYEGLQRNIHDHLNELETINKQYRRLAKEGRTDSAGRMRLMMQEVNERWDHLQQQTSAIMKCLRHSASIRHDFNSTRAVLMNWLTEVDMQLTNIEHLSHMDIATRLAEMKRIEEEIDMKRNKLAYLDESAIYLMQKGDADEVVQVQQELDEFRQYSRQVLDRVAIVHAKLELISAGQIEDIATLERRTLDQPNQEYSMASADVKLRELREARATVSVDWDARELEAYLEASPPESPPHKRRARHPRDVIDSGSLMREDRQAQIRMEVFQKAKTAKVEELMERLVDAMEDAAAKLTDAERQLHSHSPVRDARWATENIQLQMHQCEAAIETMQRIDQLLKVETGMTTIASADSQLRNIMRRWDTLQAKVCDRDQQMSQERHDFAQFKTDLDNMLAWLDEAEALQSTQESMFGDISQLNAIIRQYKDFLVQLESKKTRVLSINLISKNYINTQTAEGRELNERLRQMNRRWDAITLRASEIHKELQGALLRSQEFHHTIHDLLLWLENIETQVQQCEPINLNSEDAALWAKYSKLVDLRGDLERNQPKVLALKDTTDQLLKNSDSQEMVNSKDKIHLIANRQRTLLHLCSSYISSLEDRLDVSGRRSATVTLDRTDLTSGFGGVARMSRSSSPRVGLFHPGSSLRTRNRSPFAISRQLLFGEARPLLQASPLDSANLTTGPNIRRRRRPLLSRVLRAALPLQLLLLLLLGLACLVPVCEDDYSCTLVNNLRHSLSPMLQYMDGPPPV
ncbi:nesprin-1-like isoform X4 [Gigantopelta aegis]|uniref:nesprin-1-like isoform X4 n=1 Tax=Gigantopelta aegis TaxID=1735272 RepID=UPI001B88939A|nr:nesprin-1-like isoform X4 [Gigantopelta aegis]